MRVSPTLLSLVCLAACGPKVEPIFAGHPEVAPEKTPDNTGAEVFENEENQRIDDHETSESTNTPSSDVGEPVDNGAIDFHWSETLGSLNLGSTLAGRSILEASINGWESRSSRTPTARTAHSAPRGKRAAGYDSELDARAARRAPPPLPARPASPPAPAERVLAIASAPEPEPAADEPTDWGLVKPRGYAAFAPPSSGGDIGPIDDSSSPPTPRTASRHDVARPPSRLKAGTTDDNAQFDEWLAFIATWGARSDISGWADDLDVTGRRHLQVLDVRGRPVPNARVSVLDPTTEHVVWTGRAYGDGRVPMYPHLDVPGRDLPIAGRAPEGGWLVQAATPDGVVQTVRWDGESSELDLTVDTRGLETGSPVPVDVCFIIDTTGSMGDEIERIKSTLLSVTHKLRSDASQGVDLRYGAVLYRDIGDEYVTRRHAFTTDLAGFDAKLQTIAAKGGGDGPESLNQGLAVGVAGMDWREEAARVAFVIADAPPHMDYHEDVSYGRAASAAVHRGIRVHTVAASGLNDRGSYAFRQISQLTRGQFIYIEYGSSADTAADHGVRTTHDSNNLDEILYGRIRAEVDGWGKDGTKKVARG